MQTLYQNLEQHLVAIDDCLEKRRILACLCLLYSGIDVVAPLERTPKANIQSTFVRWVKENMLKARPMPCTALELYGARCGILHTFTPDSDLSRKGSVRKIIYAWGTAKSEDLSKAASLLGRAEVAIHIRELIDSFRAGLASYFDAIVHSPERLKRIEESADLWFTQLDQGTIAKFLNASPSERADDEVE